MKFEGFVINNGFIFQAFIVVFLILSILAIRKYIKMTAETKQIIAELDVRKYVQTIDYSEEKIVAHLDYIISSTLDQYVIFNLQPKDIYYINNKVEQDILNYMSEHIPEKISDTLMQQLRLIYNENYVAEFIGNRIYMSVLNYVIDYNVNNSPEQNDKRSSDAVKNK